MKSKTQLQSEALDRNKIYATLSLDMKIKICESMRGKSHRELNRLLAQKNSESVITS